MASLLLTREEIIDLTGAEKPSVQIKVLRDNGIQFYLRLDGYPSVPRSQFEKQVNTRVLPDFSSLKKAG